MKPGKLTMMHFFIKTDHVETDIHQLNYKMSAVILRKLAMYKSYKHTIKKSLLTNMILKHRLINCKA